MSEASAAFDALHEALLGAADPARAPAMRAYMKDVAPFLGVTSPERRRLTLPIIRALRLDAEGLEELARLLWDAPEREHAYVAIDLLDRWRRELSEESLDLLRELVLTKSWWDTVDALAGIVGFGTRRYPSWVEAMERWSTDELMWLRRVAVLHQLGQGHATDTDRLFRFVLANSADGEFFIRKAIGWALRDLAWSQPELVRAFVAEHEATLSPLSKREALKNVDRILRGDAPRRG